MAIDRKTLNRVVFGGLNVPGCTLISPAAPDWYDPALQCTPYDPVQARKLVQQSGYTNPTVQLTTPLASARASRPRCSRSSSSPRSRRSGST